MAQRERSELSVTSIGIGILAGVVMTAANVYLGLYAGMTVSASIPAAVIAMGFYAALQKKNIHGANIVQTIASAGESLAAGVIFTLPALVLVGAWTNFQFWPTTLIAIAGGLLGIIFMIPLRKTLIKENKDLTYPEGVACAHVLEAGDESGGSGTKKIMKGLVLGGIFKFFSSGLGIFAGSVEWAAVMAKKVLFFGFDASPALIGVGYIVKLEIASLVMIGGAIGWFIGIPLIGGGVEGESALGQAWTLWSTQIRYLGVGAMIVGGLWSIIGVRKGIVDGLSGLSKNMKLSKSAATAERDLGMGSLTVLLIGNLLIILGLYNQVVGNFGLSVLTTISMFLLSFLFVAVSSYIVGLVGSSNNPVSGITISALLATAIFFLVFGYKGDSAILATLGVAAVVCCAACTAGDCSQDLKTGAMIGTTPRSQQIAQIIGVVIPAFVIAPVLTLLHSEYGIGQGLKAPQATLFASITNGLFGDGKLPYDMIKLGMLLGVVTLIIDKLLKDSGAKFRLYLMPMAIGIYLPVTLAVPIFLGGLIRYFVDKSRKAKASETDGGILISSGLIAGESIMGIVIAILSYVGIKIKLSGMPPAAVELLSVAAFVLVLFYLKAQGKKTK